MGLSDWGVKFYVEVNEPVHAFAWEPLGSKFAVIHGDSQSLNVSFYQAGGEPCDAEEVREKDGQSSVLVTHRTVHHPGRAQRYERRARVRRYERLYQHGRRGALHVH